MRRRWWRSVVAKSRPDFTIHLGDVYFVGDDTEVKENFLGEKTSAYDAREMADGREGQLRADRQSRNVRARQRIFRLRAAENGAERRRTANGAAGQWASFFCLQNEHWRIIGDRHGLPLDEIRLGQSARDPEEQVHSHVAAFQARGARFRQR